MNSVFTADLLSAVAKVNSKCQVILCNSIYALAKDSAPLDIKRDENNIVASLDQSTNIYAMSKNSLCRFQIILVKVQPPCLESAS